MKNESVRGSGESKLSDLAAVLATSIPAAALNWPRLEEEAEKRIAALVLAGDRETALELLAERQRSLSDQAAAHPRLCDRRQGVAARARPGRSRCELARRVDPLNFRVTGLSGSTTPGKENEK